jgi:hypothetical protein
MVILGIVRRVKPHWEFGRAETRMEWNNLEYEVLRPESTDSLVQLYGHGCVNFFSVGRNNVLCFNLGH